MRLRKGEGNNRVRMPDDVRQFADWLAATTHTFELQHGNRRALPAGRALSLLLAAHGYLPTPTTGLDEARMREIHRIATNRGTHD